MQYGAILNTFYNIWTHSVIFALFRKIWQPFRRAYDDLAIVKLLRRRDRLQELYEASLFSRIVRAFLDLFCRIVSAICRPLAPAAESSLILRLVRGSKLLSFEYLFGAFICLMFVVPHESWNNAYALIAAVAFLLLYLILAGAHRRELIYPEKLGFPFLLFAMALVLSLLFSQARSDSLRVLSFFVTALILTYIIAADITDRKRLSRLLGFIYLSVFLTAVYAILQRALGLVVVNELFTDLTINAGVPSRVTSTLDNPNNYAEYLVLFLPLCAAFAASRKNGAVSILLLLGLAVPAVALIMTYSRSGWISMMLAVFVYVWLRNKKLIPVLIVLAVVALPLLPSSVFTRLTSFITSFIGSGYVDTSAQHRLYLWKGVGYMIKDYGVTGIGLGPESFARLYPRYGRVSIIEGAYHTQSQYFELIVELGVLGFVSFIWMILRNIKNCLIESRRASGTVYFTLIACVAAFIGIAFACVVEYIWFYPRDLFAYFILLGVSYAAVNISSKEKE